MRTFTLRFEDDGLGEPKTVQFDSDDAHEAFSILSRELSRRRVSLYDGENRLGTIRRTAEDGWQIGD
jgi:hypothetical protein